MRAPALVWPHCTSWAAMSSLLMARRCYPRPSLHLAGNMSAKPLTAAGPEGLGHSSLGTPGSWPTGEVGAREELHLLLLPCWSS